MIIQTQLVAAVRCHQCGRVLTQPVSLFRTGTGTVETISCSCGNSDIHMGGRRAGELWLRLPCPVCSRTHFLTLSTRRLRRGEVQSLFCPITSLQMGYVGEAHDIVGLVELWEEELEEELLEDWAEYFDYPEVMYEILDRLHTLAEADELRCGCGNSDIEMEIFPDRLELFCNECGRKETLLAIDEEDLLRVQTLEVLGDTPDTRDRAEKGQPDFFFKNRK